MGRGTKRGSGRVVAKLIEELERHGMLVHHVMLTAGRVLREDCYRWEAFGTSKAEGDFSAVPVGMNVSVGGWKTVTRCVRNGVTIDRNPRDAFGVFEADPVDEPT